MNALPMLNHTNHIPASSPPPKVVPVSNGTWTDERVEFLKKLWVAGLSASQVADEIGHGITRNAVIGKVHRLGLSNNLTSEQRAQRALRQQGGRPRRERQPHRKMIKVKRQDGTVTQALEPYVPNEPPPPNPQFMCTMQELGPIQANEPDKMKCRAPIGDPGTEEFRYCGEPGAFPYCAFHHRLYYQPGTATGKKRDEVPTYV